MATNPSMTIVEIIGNKGTDNFKKFHDVIMHMITFTILQV